MLINKTEIYIIKNQLQNLIKYPYAKQEVQIHLNNLINGCDRLLDKYPEYPEQIYYFLSTSLWKAVQFLSGSTINETPYEMVACLDKALGDWYSEKNSLTTALLSEKGYFFLSSDHQNILKRFFNDTLDIKLDLDLIQIALPKAFRNYPLYNIALYHELGHFIDIKFSIINLLLLGDKGEGLSENHLREHFADIFASCYTGSAVLWFLQHCYGDSAANDSHPSTKDRILFVTDFLKGNDNPLINSMIECCDITTRKALKTKFKLPSIEEPFNDFRPVRINDEAELHGLFIAGWEFLRNSSMREKNSWKYYNEFEIFKIVNDLIEKSIRNYVMVEKWNS